MNLPGEIKRSVCPYDCPDTCGLLVEVVDGKAIKVSGDPEHPFTRGTLCPKMNHYERTVHSPLRLTTPLLRRGPKGSGQFRPVSWKEAIQQIANHWKKIVAEYGGEAILPYSYAGTMGLIQRNQAILSFIASAPPAWIGRSARRPRKPVGKR
jgi:anaerobic selenocysteine-containing dehydrogenase